MRLKGLESPAEEKTEERKSSEAQNERGKDMLLSDSVKLGQGLAAGIKARASHCLSLQQGLSWGRVRDY